MGEKGGRGAKFRCLSHHRRPHHGLPRAPARCPLRCPDTHLNQKKVFCWCDYISTGTVRCNSKLRTSHFYINNRRDVTETLLVWANTIVDFQKPLQQLRPLSAYGFEKHLTYLITFSFSFSRRNYKFTHQADLLGFHPGSLWEFFPRISYERCTDSPCTGRPA